MLNFKQKSYEYNLLKSFGQLDEEIDKGLPSAKWILLTTTPTIPYAKYKEREREKAL